MSRSNFRAITVQVRFDAVCDGVVRLVNDAQRLGFAVRALTMEVQADDAVANLSLLVPEAFDLNSLAFRFSRHPTFRGAARIREASRPADCADLVAGTEP